jgi:FKBP-type peptidyl-prolyl cis-trans isomerase SlyD
MDPCLRRDDGRERDDGQFSSSSRRRGSIPLTVILAKAGIHPLTTAPPYPNNSDNPCFVQLTIRNLMKIDKNSAVTLRFKVTDSLGKVVEESNEPMVYLHGGYGNTLPKIEEALDGQETGYKVTLALAAADAFGLRDENLMQTIPKSQFPPGVKVGGQLEGRGEDGRAQAFTVVKIKGDTVILDGNHPLAGKDLRFALAVMDVRPASEEEIAHGHVHGEHGHHH